MIAQIVRFTSGMPEAEVLRTYRARAPQYRALTGLVEKYYLRFPGGEHGAVYLWESRDAMQAFRESDLARSIPDAYKVQGAPDVQIAEIVFALRGDESPGA
jgi:heme-degrading monooxygenase HmoA